MSAPQLKIDAGRVNLTPAEWVDCAAAACGEKVARVEVQVRTGTKGAALVLEAEQTSGIATIEGPDGPADLASRYWTVAVEYAQKTEGRIAVRLVVHVPNDEASPFETRWVEPGDAEITVADPGMDGGASLAWRMVMQMHNMTMRKDQGIAGLLQSLNVAALSAMNLSGEAIDVRNKAAMGLLEAQRDVMELEGDEKEFDRYERMFETWLRHMSQSKAMNDNTQTITPPSTIQDAAAALANSLTRGQVDGLREILGDDEAHDVIEGLESASKATGLGEAEAIVQAILIRVAPKQAELARVFAPPLVPQNIAAFQNACLQVLAQASPLH